MSISHIICRYRLERFQLELYSTGRQGTYNRRHPGALERYISSLCERSCLFYQYRICCISLVFQTSSLRNDVMDIPCKYQFAINYLYLCRSVRLGICRRFRQVSWSCGSCRRCERCYWSYRRHIWCSFRVSQWCWRGSSARHI